MKYVLKSFSFFTLALLIVAACTTPKEGDLPMQSEPPVAKKVDKELTIHGDTRVDPYYWMRDRENSQVVEHLKSENAYTRYMMKPMGKLQATLFEEMKGRVKKNDESVPNKFGNHYYFRFFNETSEYPIVARKKDFESEEREVILDSNELAKGQKYFQMSNWDMSPDEKIIAFATDTVGRRIYNINFKDLSTGKILPFKIENVTSNFSWSGDNRYLFYTKQNPKTLRYEWIYRFDFETQKSDLVFHEKDEKFYAYVWMTTSQNFLMIGSSSSESSETHYLPAKSPLQKPRLFARRRPKHEYEVSDAGNFFLVKSNSKAQNFKVFRTPNHKRTEEKHWRTFVGHRKDVLLDSVRAFKSFFAFGVRKGGLTEIEVMDRSTGKVHTLPMKEESHVAYISSNWEFDTNFLRYSYQSMTTPYSIIDYDLKSRKHKTRKVQEVLGGFNADNYESTRTFAVTKDGVRVPISIVHRKGIKLDGENPTLLYSYGSYGSSSEPSFSTTRLSLLDRGFVFAIAHVRGGSEMGRHWYLDGKRFKKRNTFTDFISVAETLIDKKYTNPKQLFIYGGSAGGLLVGAVINMRPDLFNGAVAAVPFVDVVTTMLDESIPLTTNEFEEWGNPKDKKYYEYIKSYSPYDNVKAQDYPHLLVTSGFHDSQVQYWEPTKWVARLRDVDRKQKRDIAGESNSERLLLLHTDMEAGHGGKSGRFKRLEDSARDYAFIIYLSEQAKKNR